MNTPNAELHAQLVELLGQLQLRPGEAHTVEVNGRRLTIRDEDADEPSVYQGQVMLLPWFDSPRQPGIVGLANPGKLSSPDPVVIPPDEEGER